MNVREKHDGYETGLELPLGNRVYDQLKDEILTQRIPSATLLQETEVGDRLRVSRTPVREALRALLREGFIRRHGRFYQVATITIRQIRDIFEIRDALERTAVRLFINRAPDSTLRELKQTVEQQSDALARNDMTTIVSLDRKFHLAIAEAADNPLLFQQISSIHDKVMLIHGQKIETTPTWFNGIIAEHERILSALGRRDVAVADAEMRYHLESVVRLHLGLKQEPYKKDIYPPM